MRQCWRRYLLDVIAAAACTDATSATTTFRPSGSSRTVIEEGDQNPPPGVAPEDQNYTTIDVSVGTGFMGNKDGFGQTLVSYAATNATASVKLEMRNASGA